MAFFTYKVRFKKNYHPYFLETAFIHRLQCILNNEEEKNICHRALKKKKKYIYYVKMPEKWNETGRLYNLFHLGTFIVKTP